MSEWNGPGVEMRLTKVVTVRTLNLSSLVPDSDLAAISRAFRPPYKMTVTYTDDQKLK
jgi:hypothetical protein